MKSKEALKRITSEINNYKLSGIGDKNWLGIQDVLKDVNILEKALTPPTADEVCKALSKHLKYIVTYYENAFEISYGTKNKEYVAYYIDYLGTKIEKILPPHLITLIGRFYEGLEKAGK